MRFYKNINLYFINCSKSQIIMKYIILEQFLDELDENINESTTDSDLEESSAESDCDENENNKKKKKLLLESEVPKKKKKISGNIVQEGLKESYRENQKVSDKTTEKSPEFNFRSETKKRTWKDLF